MAILSWASVLLVSALAVIGCAGRRGWGPTNQDYGGTVLCAPTPEYVCDPVGWAKYAMGLLPGRLVFKWDAV